MWDHIINIHLSKLLSTKTKESRINELLKKKNKKKKRTNLHFIPNTILTNFFKNSQNIKITINNI